MPLQLIPLNGVPLLGQPKGNKTNLSFGEKTMKVARRKASSALVAMAAIAMTLLINAQPTHAQTETVLYSFCSQAKCADGANPYASVITDKKGNLYGTTFSGGANNLGTVFELSPGKKGVWTETVLYSFCSEPNCADGSKPYGGLILDKDGDLYGTTSGANINGGTLFKLAPPAQPGDTWTETVLHNFAGCYTDGQNPDAGVIMDKEGNLYGTTSNGGPYCGLYSGGTVFKWTPAGEEPLFSFGGADGANPVAGVVLGKKSNLYGTTYYGGAGSEDGTVFKVTPTGSETILHSFTGAPGDGANPEANLVLDKKGNAYGTTLKGGTDNVGTIFEVASNGQETVLHSFTNSPNDGANPYAGLVTDKAGNLYGTTVNGGAYGTGTAFAITPSGTESWVYSFQSGSGTNPYAGLFMGKKGVLYGTTVNGGAHNAGTVFELTP